MLPAREAKKETQNNINNCNTRELLYLDKCISNAIKSGKFSFSILGNLYHSTQMKLTELGYKIKTDKDKNDQSYYIIDWP